MYRIYWLDSSFKVVLEQFSFKPKVNLITELMCKDFLPITDSIYYNIYSGTYISIMKSVN